MSINNPQQKRAFWLRHLHQWHWISSALCLVAMLLFAITGFTLNHAADIESRPQVTRKNLTMPPSLLNQLQQITTKDTPRNNAQDEQRTLPLSSRTWIAQELHIDVSDKIAEWSPEEVYLALPQPGGDAWLRISLDTGEMEYEKTTRGVIAYLNDLHKGRNTGSIWTWFIDLFALVCLIFCLTGLVLLQMHAQQRKSTWPIVAAGLVIPLIIGLIWMH